MKFTKYIIGLAIFIGLLAMTYTAFADADTGFALGSTNRNTALSYVIVPEGGALSGMAPRVQYINAGSSNLAAKVQFYKVIAKATATYTNSTTTLYVNSTNTGISADWQSQTLIIRHQLDKSLEKRTLTANNGATNMVVTAAPLGTVLPGDQLYLASTTGAGVIFWGASTNSVGPTPSGVFIGQKDTPLLLEINGGTDDAALNIVSGDYIR